MATLGRYEGRLFVNHNRLCMVVEADTRTGIARVSSRVDGRVRLEDMPISEVSERLSHGPLLDNLRGPNAEKRVVEREEGWFFKSREGYKGPYDSSDEAQDGLSEYVIAAQGN